MSVYATWTLDNGAYRGIVVCSKTFNTTARTANTYTTPEAATKGAREYIDQLEAKKASRVPA